MHSIKVTTLECFSDQKNLHSTILLGYILALVNRHSGDLIVYLQPLYKCSLKDLIISTSYKTVYSSDVVIPIISASLQTVKYNMLGDII
ncbi:MAG: hypothetical protein VX237_03950, partial [Chloroflexota bacterium]|nr:hypothetical protein [Chloroflexota bacterium]